MPSYGSLIRISFPREDNLLPARGFGNPMPFSPGQHMKTTPGYKGLEIHIGSLTGVFHDFLSNFGHFLSLAQ